MNGNKYVLKRQKISEEMYKDKSTKNPIMRELELYKWIDTLNKSDSMFFASLEHFELKTCEFNFIPIRGKLSDEVLNSNYCAEFIISKKDGIVDNIYNDMTNDEITSCFVQCLYALYLMHKDGFYYMDTKSDNVFWNHTNYDTIKLGKLGKIKTFGKQYGLIDYGNIINMKFDRNNIEDIFFSDPKKRKLFLGNDIYLLVDYLLLNIMNVCQFIENDKIGFNRRDILKILKYIFKYNKEKYINVMNFCKDILKISDIYDLDEFLKSDEKYEVFTKDFLLRGYAYEVIQMFHIKYKDTFYNILNKLYNVNIENNFVFDKDVLIKIKKNRHHIKKIISLFVISHKNK